VTTVTRLLHTAARLRDAAADNDHPDDVVLASALADVLKVRSDLWWTSDPDELTHAVDRLAEVLAAATDDADTDDIDGDDEGTAP
jgi:hypothetical protein